MFTIKIGSGSINPFYNEGGQSHGTRIHRLTCNRGGQQPDTGAGKRASLLCEVNPPHQRCSWNWEKYRNHQWNEEKTKFEFLFTKLQCCPPGADHVLRTSTAPRDTKNLLPCLWQQASPVPYAAVCALDAVRDAEAPRSNPHGLKKMRKKITTYSHQSREGHAPLNLHGKDSTNDFYLKLCPFWSIPLPPFL